MLPDTTAKWLDRHPFGLPRRLVNHIAFSSFCQGVFCISPRKLCCSHRSTQWGDLKAFHSGRPRGNLPRETVDRIQRSPLREEALAEQIQPLAPSTRLGCIGIRNALEKLRWPTKPLPLVLAVEHNTFWMHSTQLAINTVLKLDCHNFDNVP